MKPLHIAAGIIRNSRQEIFITQRKAGVHMAHKWEFPGGKLEAGESPVQALKRELAEEVDILLSQWRLFDRQSCYLADKQCRITLWFYLVTGWQGTPRGREGQPARWLAQRQLSSVDFPPTNMPVVQRLLNK